MSFLHILRRLRVPLPPLVGLVLLRLARFIHLLS